MNIKEIRKAVTCNIGGQEEATDGQIRYIWMSLDNVTRAEYLRSISDVTNGTKRNMQDNSIGT